MRRLITLLGTVALWTICCGQQEEGLEKKAEESLTLEGAVIAASPNDSLCNGGERFDIEITGDLENLDIERLATYEGAPVITVCSTISPDAFEDRKNDGWWNRGKDGWSVSDEFFTNKYRIVAIPRIVKGEKLVVPPLYCGGMVDSEKGILLYDLVSMIDTFDYSPRLDMEGSVKGFAFGTDESEKVCGKGKTMYDVKHNFINKTYVVCSNMIHTDSDTSVQVVADKIGVNDTGRAVYQASIFERI